MPLLIVAQSYPSETMQLPLHSSFNFGDMAQYELVNPPIRIVQNFGKLEDHKEKITPTITEADKANTVRVKYDFSATRTSSPMPTTHFSGLLGDPNFYPPDINAAVSSDYLMLVTNMDYRIQTKTGAIINTVSKDGFWSGMGMDFPGSFDARILYDSYSNRWIIACSSKIYSKYSSLFVAVSQTNDPNGNWYRYKIDIDSSNASWLDFPCLTVNKDWIVISGSIMPLSDIGVGGTKIWVLNKTNALSGSSADLTTIKTMSISPFVCPSVIYHNTLSCIYFVEDYINNVDGDAYLRIYKLSGQVPTLEMLGLCSTNLPYELVSIDAPQAGTNVGITTLGSFIRSVIYRNGLLYIAHSVYLPLNAPTHSAIQWWVVNIDNLKVQQAGRIEDTTGTIHYAYPSLMVNSKGDMAVGFAQFSASTFPSAAYAVRLANDPINTFRSPYMYKAGLNTSIVMDFYARNRWGDYTSVVLDPNDDTFWVLQQYTGKDANIWGAWWANVLTTPYVPCSTAPSELNTSQITNSTAIPTWAPSGGTTSYNLQYKLSTDTTWISVNTTSPSFSLSGLVANTTYDYRVQAVCSSTHSEYSSISHFTTAANPCTTAPTNLKAINMGSTFATLTWEQVYGASSYKIQYKSAAATSWTTTTSTTNHKVLNELQANTTYYFQVQGICNVDISIYSPLAEFTTIEIPACEDITEPNNTFMEASYNSININANLNAQISSLTDLDYYLFRTNKTQNLYITLTNLPADYDMKLYDMTGKLLGFSQNVNTLNEAISYKNLPEGDYIICIYGYKGAFSTTGCYQLGLTSSADTFPSVMVKNREFQLMPNPASQSVTVFHTSDKEEVINLKVYDPTGREVGNYSIGLLKNENKFSIDLTYLTSGIYTLQMQGNKWMKSEKLMVVGQ